MTPPPPREPYIRMFSGRRIYVRAPELNPEIHLSDIAYGLARIARFTGQTRHRYSVASHCLMVADLTPGADRRLPLLHDAVEAILGDVSSPLKSLLADYKALEHRWELGMSARWGVSLRDPAVKAADTLAYAIERRDLCPYGDRDAGPWDIERAPEVEIPPSAPRCTAYADSPTRVAHRWLDACRFAGVPEVV